MFRDKGPIWVYEEEDLVFNAEPGVVRFGEKRDFLKFLMPLVLFLIGGIIFSSFFQNYVVYNYEKMMDENGDEPCWPEWEDRIILTNGTYMCNHEWNTYRIKGLPKTPIANPGYQALYAAAHPKKTDYLYFVADGEGGHNFAKTLDAHNRNVRQYRNTIRKKQKNPTE